MTTALDGIGGNTPPPTKVEENKVVAFGRNVVKGATYIRGNTSTLASTLRLGQHIGLGLETFRGKQALFTGLQKQVALANFLNALCFGDLFYWSKANGEEREKDSNFAVAGNVCGTTVTLLCVPLLLQDLGFIKLSRIAESIGQKVRVFSFIAKVSIGVVLQSLLIGLNVLFGADAARRLTTAKEGFEKKSAMLDVAKCVAGCAYYTFALCAGALTASAAVLGTIALGIFSYGLSVTAALYKELAKPPKEPKLIEPNA